jgi:hypothetical protein
MNVRTSISVLFVLLLSLSTPVHAQDPAVPEDPVDRLFEEVRDDSRPATVRAAAISRLLAEGGEAARSGLADMLASEDTTDELRLLIVEGALTASGCPLLDQVVDLTADPVAGFAAEVRKRFKAAGRAALVKALADRISAEGVEPARAALLIDLLGVTERKEAIPVLLHLWENGDAAVGAAATAALLVIIPERFATVVDARAFWEEHKSLSLADIRGKLLRKRLNGEKKDDNDPAVGPLVELARRMVVGAPLKSLIENYLQFADLAEIRKIGAEQLAKYPFEEREGEGAAEARKTAAAALLEGLDTETDDAVALALLGAARTLTRSLLALNPERTVHVITRRLPSENRDIRLAAVATLGDLGDRRAIADLIRQFDGAPATDPEFRLAVLNALELIRNAQDVSNGGMSKWILARLDPVPPVLRQARWGGEATGSVAPDEQVEEHPPDGGRDPWPARRPPRRAGRDRGARRGGALRPRRQCPGGLRHSAGTRSGRQGAGEREGGPVREAQRAGEGEACPDGRRPLPAPDLGGRGTREDGCTAGGRRVLDRGGESLPREGTALG